MASEISSAEAFVKAESSSGEFQVLENVSGFGDSPVAPIQSLPGTAFPLGHENNQPGATMNVVATQPSMEVKTLESCAPIQVVILKHTELENNFHGLLFQSDLLKLQNSIHQMEERGMTSDPRYFQAKQLLLSVSAR
jgi:hypothetical protein